MTIYARQFSFIVDPSCSSELEKIADMIYKITRKQQGFVNATYMRNMETGEFIALTIWKTKDDADAFFAELALDISLTIGRQFKSLPTVQWYELYVPKE